MIARYIFGEPFDTEAVLNKPEACTQLPVFITRNESVFTIPLNPEDIVFGLGEQVRGMNKRGHTYISWNTDEFDHSEDKHSLYGSHNFFIVTAPGQKATGYFLDYGGKVTFDMGYTRLNEITITVDSADFELYIITGDTAAAVTKEFRAIIGQPYLPPKWAFGVGQSRWGYGSETDMYTVTESYRKNHIPLDMVYLDIDYMDQFEDFTISSERFSDFAAMNRTLKEQHVRVIPIIDAGVKQLEGYKTYEEGRKNGYFCKNADGTDFVAGVWPGDCCFPDFLNPEARKWFGDSYSYLVDQGIDGFWNDMNEPSLFYSKEHLEEVRKQLPSYVDGELSIYKNFALKDLIAGLSCNEDDYRRFYHTVNGRKINHHSVHNLYGYNMTRAASESMAANYPDRKLFFSRSSYIGMHRHSGIWMGDNKSRWQHILLNLQMLASLNMVGFLYTGADTGGFGADTTEDLMQRWYALSIFTPLFRNHSCLGTREQEPYRFPDALESLRGILGLRYRLLPYLYSEFMKAALDNRLYARPIGFDYPDDADAMNTQDQAFIGESIMIAPVYEQNATGRHVYLPEAMTLVRFKGCELEESVDVPAGHTWITVPLDEIVFFIKKGHLLPLAEPAEFVDGVDWNTLTLLGDDGATYELYNDDGLTQHPEYASNLHILKK